MHRPGGTLLSAVSLCNVVISSLSVSRNLEPAPQQVLQQPSDTPPSIPAPERKLHGKFLHITDLHPDEFYKVHSSTDEESACHRGEGPAGYYGAETSDCDSPFSLINATFDWIEEHVKDKIDFIIWTGDSARHDSDEGIPRSSKQVLGTNSWIASKFRDLLWDEAAKAMSIPVIPTFGNNDILPHNVMMPGPNAWLQYYAKIWADFVPEEQRHSFEFGGWFYVEVIPDKLAVFSLNTLYFFDRNAAIDDCISPAEPGFKQLEWLRVQLQFLRERGMKAILIGHVPPARTPSKMLWDESCWQKYTLWLQQYRDVVTASIFGHMNIDHFMLQDTEDIDAGKLIAGSVDAVGRVSMQDELTVRSASDYLMELRDDWSKIPMEIELGLHELASEADQSSKKKHRGKGKGRKKKSKLGGPWAERYQVSMVGPSVVPNFFPTLRIVEYNITGLDHSALWKGQSRSLGGAPAKLEIDEQRLLELRDKTDPEIEKKKRHKARKPKDSNLVIPLPPAKSAPPGPAYSPQPLTLVGYKQYFANLTLINNDMVDRDNVDSSRWRHGKHRGKNPNKSPDPREYRFEVEYSTFEDDILRLPDLTVSSFVKLAYRMGKRGAGVKSLDADSKRHEDEEPDQAHESKQGADESEDGTVEDDHLRKHKKHKKHNKVWLHFLGHAFVSTLDRQALKKLDY